MYVLLEYLAGGMRYDNLANIKITNQLYPYTNTHTDTLLYQIVKN